MRFSRSRRPVQGLPVGRHFALTWEIPDNFGGLTKAMLQRSNAFAQSTGTTVSILTFGWQPNLDDVRADLVKRGFLGKGVVLHNLWEDVRVMTDDALREAQFDPQFTESSAVDTEAVRILRADGSLVATQLWARVGAGAPMCEHGDYVLETALWAQDGSFIGGWRGSWGLWKFWVDRQMSGHDSYAIVDSSVIADFMVHRGPDSATTIYLFHNNHLLRRREPPYAPLDRWRRYVCEHHADFDAVVFLTETQRLDFARLMGDAGNSHTILNIMAKGTVPRDTERFPARAVALARFAPQKRLDHALRAVAAASQANPDLHLDLYGTGPREADLRMLAAELQAPIAFHDYTESPATEFARSSFSLLTSTHEGLGLSVIESMAAGCVPLAYDVPYGPSDIITHGVDGFLVPAGDHRAMAKQIHEFLALEPRTVNKMRKAARTRAESFVDSSIIAKWGATLSAAQGRRAYAVLPALTHEALAMEEAKAAIARFSEAVTRAELVAASWSDDKHLTMTVCAHASDHDPNRGVIAKLVHVPTGDATSIPVTKSAAPDTKADPPGSTYVELNVDISDLPGALDHTILIGLTSGDATAWDVIRTHRVAHDWLAFPTASAHRSVLLFDKKRGIHVVTATPKVAAAATTRGLDVSLAIEPLIAGTIDSVQAVGLKGSPSVEARQISPTVFAFQLPISGTWEVRAVVDGTSRLVACAASSDELNASTESDNAVRVGASPRGYLRLETRTTG